MERTTIILENGQTITAGLETPALETVELTRSVNSQEELASGSVCAAMVQIQLILDGDCPIGYADRFTLYRGKKQVGIFQAEKPKWISAHRVQITAYDAVIRLDQDLSGYFNNLETWPATLKELAQLVCAACQVTLEDKPFPNQDYPAKPFRGSNITGRKVLSWIAQAAGCFCTADERGVLTFGWYSPVQNLAVGPRNGDSLTATLEEKNLTISGITATLEETDLQLQGLSGASLDETGNLTLQGDLQVCFYQGSLELADYQTAPIEKVQIRQDSADVGVMYPDIGEANTYVISGNPLLTAETPEDLLPMAQSLHKKLQGVAYTPCSFTVDADTGLKPGHIVTITDGNGRQVTTYLMESCLKGRKETFKSTGSATRDSVSVTHDSSWQALSGKVLQLQTDVEGLRVAHQDAEGNSAQLLLTMSGIENQVTGHSNELESVKQQMTLLRQEKDSLELKIQSIEEDGVRQVVTATGYRFSEEGLQISKSGMEMENLLDHTGMRVTRNGQKILQADNQGVAARDVSVKNYLVVGDHARFEDYGTGTACFYIG